MIRQTGASLDAVEAVYRLRLSELRRVATAITGDRETGLDAVQEGFAIAVRQRATYRGEGSLEAWIWRIVVNAARDQTASRSKRAAERSDQLETSVLEPAGHDDGGVRECVARLPERQRLVLFLSYYADLDYNTIAHAVGISPGTVGATLNQARRTLRRLIEEVTT